MMFAAAHPLRRPQHVIEIYLAHALSQCCYPSQRLLHVVLPAPQEHHLLCPPEHSEKFIVSRLFPSPSLGGDRAFSVRSDV